MATASSPRLAPAAPLRRRWRGLLLAGVVGILIGTIWAHTGGAGSSPPPTDLAVNNLSAGLINSVQVGYPWSCLMMTAAGQRDLTHLLGATPQRVANLKSRGLDVCATVVINAPRSVRVAAMKPFLNASSGGEYQAGSTIVQWNRTSDGQYALMTFESKDGGVLATSMRIARTCSACQ